MSKNKEYYIRFFLYCFIYLLVIFVAASVRIKKYWLFHIVWTLVWIYSCVKFHLSHFGKRTDGVPKRIFMYWDSGWNGNDLPDLCLESWRYHNPDWEIVTLDSDTINRWISDTKILDKIKEVDLVQHKADIIRTALLYEHGGVWADATIYCNKPLSDWLMDYQYQGFFCFKYNKSSGLEDYKLGNWFLACDQHNDLLKTFADKYWSHWKNRVKDHYFGFHFLFNFLCRSDKDFDKTYRGVSFLDARKIRVTVPEFNKKNKEIKLLDPLDDWNRAIFDDKDRPIFKFRSKDFKDNFSEHNLEGTVLEYLMEKIGY